MRCCAQDQDLPVDHLGPRSAVMTRCAQDIDHADAAFGKHACRICIDLQSAAT